MRIRAPTVPLSWKSLQLLLARVVLPSMSVIVAWASAPAEMKTKATPVLASTAQWVNNRFMRDSLCEMPTMVPRHQCKFRASFSMETINFAELYNNFPHCAKQDRTPSVSDLPTLGHDNDIDGCTAQPHRARLPQIVTFRRGAPRAQKKEAGPKTRFA